jgi:hypothetical protein
MPGCVRGRESFYLPKLETVGKYARLEDQVVIQGEGTGDEGGVLFLVGDDGVGFDVQYSDELFGIFGFFAQCLGARTKKVQVSDSPA